jgi:hypothetical protein
VDKCLRAFGELKVDESVKSGNSVFCPLSPFEFASPESFIFVTFATFCGYIKVGRSMFFLHLLPAHLHHFHHPITIF